MGLDWKTRGVLADFRRCQIASRNTDLVFHCTNGKVSAHQMIFAGISRLFKNLMQRYVIGQELIPLDLNISLPEICREHMEMVVEVVYTGQVNLTTNDYASFREICQLLELRLPIADYDHLCVNQCNDSDDGRSNDNGQDFHALKAMELAGSSEVSNPSTVKRGREQQGSSSTHKNSFFPQNDEPTFNCPDCLKGIPSKRILSHLIVHLKKQLNEFIADDQSVPGLEKCKLCPYEASSHGKMRRHVGVTHKILLKIANKSQMKFLQGAGGKIARKDRSSSKVHKLLPIKIVNARSQIFPNEDSPVEWNIERNDALADSNEGETHVLEDANEEESNAVEDVNKCASHAMEDANESELHVVEDTNESESHAVEDANKSASNVVEDANEYELHVVENANLCLSNAVEDANQSESRTVEDANEYESNAVATVNESESLALNVTNLAGSPEVSNPSTGRRVSKRQRSSTNYRSLFYSPNNGPTFECPDCLKRLPSTRIPNHVMIHLDKDLKEFITDSPSVPGHEKCKLCSHEASSHTNIRIHVGVTHKILLELANDAQMKFLQNAGGMFAGKKSSSLKPIKLLPNKSLRRGSKFPLKEDLREVSDIQKENTSEDASKTESHALTTMELTGSAEVANPSTGRRVSKRQRSSTIDESLFYSPNDELTFECPDCLRHLPSTQVQNHVIIHLEKELNKFITDRRFAPGLEKCKLCSFEASSHTNMRRHVGLSHNLILKFANEAQKQFLIDSGIKQIDFNELECFSCPTLPKKKKMMMIKKKKNQSKAPGTYLEKEDLSQRENKEIDTVVEDEDPSKRKENNGETENDNENAMDNEDLSQKETNETDASLEDDCALENTKETESLAHKISSKSRIDLNTLRLDVEAELPSSKPLKKPNLKESLSPVYARNDENFVKCPDCQKDIIHYQARKHMAIHLRKYLDKFVVIDNFSALGRNKCKFCGLIHQSRTDLICHVGLSHNLIMKYANEAQRQFLIDSGTNQRKLKNLDCSARLSLPTKTKKKMSKEPDYFHSLRGKDFSKMEEDIQNIETNSVEDENGRNIDTKIEDDNGGNFDTKPIEDDNGGNLDTNSVKEETILDIETYSIKEDNVMEIVMEDVCGDS